MNALLSANYQYKLYFDACPHCKTGTVELTWDMWGYYLHCVACGWLYDYYVEESLKSVIKEDKEDRVFNRQKALKRLKKARINMANANASLRNVL